MKKRSNRPRNLLHDHPMLRKGGVHDKSNKAKRRKERQGLRKAWFSLSAYSVLSENHAFPTLSPSPSPASGRGV